jgi:hypothetical protein
MVVALVMLGILVGTVITFALLLRMGLRSIRDTSNKSQEDVTRRAVKVFVPLVLVSVIGSQLVFGVIAHFTGVNTDTGGGFALFFGVSTVCLVPVWWLAVIFGRRYRDAGRTKG